MLHVGDAATARLTIRHGPGEEVRVPIKGHAEEVVILDQSKENRNLSETVSVSDITYTFTSFELGTHTFTTGAVALAGATGQDTETLIPLKTFEVVPLVTNDSAAIRDIKNLADWERASPRWIWAFLLVALLSAIAGFAALHFLSKPRTILHHAPPPPSHELALRALKRLKEKGWIEQRQIEPFYVELSNIVRQYIENRFDLRAPEQTTEEFIREASHARKLQPEHQQLTAEFLAQSDLVKFARHEPDEETMRGALAAAERLVAETIPESSDEERSAEGVVAS
jgi:hypothetical protein